MAFDMGGPVNKAAYTFAVGLLASKIYTPMAAVIAAGMTPPLGLALAALLFKNRFDLEEREAGGPALVLGFRLSLKARSLLRPKIRSASFRRPCSARPWQVRFRWSAACNFWFRTAGSLRRSFRAR